VTRWAGCPCGAEQHDTTHPAPRKAYLITDADLDAATAYGKWSEAEHGEDDPISSDAFEARARVVWTCWSCGRLLVFGEDGGELTVYERRES